ncbi:uncharacterized protein [Trachinotus anak]|uniref:uncharacterized protein n=1 Tax=Trachinotus anak TaxID=443729 RepID=UPI0039F17693
MKVWLKDSTLVLLTVAVAALVVPGQQYVIVDNTTKKEEVTVGSSLTLHCGLGTESYERFRVGWYFNRSGPSWNQSQNISEKIVNKNSTEGKKDEMKLILLNVTYENSGWYFCKVTSEIPRHTITNSSGTQILIAESFEKTTYPSLLTSKQVAAPKKVPVPWWMWILLGVSVFILIVMLLLYTLLRKKCGRTDEDPVYINTRPSPRPGKQVSNLKTVPSSQNLCTPSCGRRYEEGKRRPQH